MTHKRMTSQSPEQDPSYRMLHTTNHSLRWNELPTPRWKEPHNPEICKKSPHIGILSLHEVVHMQISEARTANQFELFFGDQDPMKAEVRIVEIHRVEGACVRHIALAVGVASSHRGQEGGSPTRRASCSGRGSQDHAVRLILPLLPLHRAS